MAGYSSQYGTSGGNLGSDRNGKPNYDDGLAYGYGERVPGARRQKVMGYLRAANELRQSYQNTISTRYLGDEDTTPPGGFPDMDTARRGDEEMILFPSYARKHVKRKYTDHPSDSAGARNTQNGQAANDYGDSGDSDYWRREWEKHEDKNAVVDVDVRGWIYSPQKGPLTRRNRLILAVARRLSGIPAPDQSPSNSRDSSQHRGFRSRVHDSIMSQEEEAAAREAEIIAIHGQREADAASKGDYSSESSFRNSRIDSSNSLRAGDEEVSQKRSSWNLQASDMTREELLKANDELMTRLRPFMTLPLASAPITVFFFNDEKSQSKSVTTDESGHFNLRAALDFVPTKVRVLASEQLSAVEDIIITEPNGVSLVSDVDDTIKHSAIASGAKEIFKNTFIRDLGDLSIQGVKEWYTRVADLGVQLHYVSNSPWQLYPLLKSYFKLTGLPPGSIHLKQYSGMLQGIFEPAAERKKASLERIMHDFPERKFILVGDSGEADLEVYTDIVVANPGRVLGVFIRDVTTTSKKHTVQQTIAKGHFHGDGATSSSESPPGRPALPARPKPPANTPSTEDLISFEDDLEHERLEKTSTSSSYMNDMEQLRASERTQGPPNKPAKPSNLRSYSTSSQFITSPQVTAQSNSTTSEAKRTPPPPPKPRRSTRPGDSAPADDRVSQRPSFASSRQHQNIPERMAPPSRTSSSLTQSSTSSSYGNWDDDGYLAAARRQLATAYNALPPIRSQSPAARTDGSSSPPRRGLSSYPAAAARWAAGAAYDDPITGSDVYNKKEEMWKRRWAQSAEIMKRNGVVLRSWRVGSDVMDECIRLIEKAKAKVT